MSNTLSLANFNRSNVIAQTALTVDLAAGVNSLPVGNSANFSGGGYVIIGNLGASTSELATATAPGSSTAIPLSGVSTLPHNFNDAVTLLFGNQLRVYRANDVSGNGTQPPDTNFSLVATVGITPNKSLTAYTDGAGVSGQWYKYTYYNSATTSETALADSRAVQTGAVHYVSIDQVRRAASLTTNSKVSEDVIAEYRDSAEKEVNGALQAVYVLPLPQPTNPIVIQITKNIAAGELMQEVYSPVAPAMVAMGETKAAHGRQGDGDNVTGLMQLVDRSVVLQDANFIELSIDEAHGFGGWPDETTRDTTGTLSNAELGATGKDHGFEFWVGKEY